MQADDLFEKMKAGDQQAFKEWFGARRESVAKFAFQAGLPKQHMGSFLAAVAESVKKKSGSLNASNEKSVLFLTAVQALKLFQDEMADETDTYALKFEEDREAHTALIKLSVPLRMAIVLVYFHGKKVEEAAGYLTAPTASVKEDIRSGLDQLREDLSAETDEDVVKRLLLLDKSYNRMDFSDVPEEAATLEPLMDEPEKKFETQNKPQRMNRKISLLAGASLFLAVVIGASFYYNDQPGDTQQAAIEENPTSVSKAMVKAWEAQYEEIRSSAPERLGLSEEVFESLEYVQTADALRDRTFSRQNVRQLKDDPERMQNQVDKLMLSIETPKGMLDSVGEYQMMSSETSDFLLIYTEKTDQLLVITNGLLEKYKDELPQIEDNGHIAAIELTRNDEDYPEELKNLTEAMDEYMFQFMAHPSGKRFTAVRDINRFYSIHPFNSSMESLHYLDVMQSMSYLHETGALGSIEYLPYPVISMARFLSDPSSSTALKAKVEPQMLAAFNTLLKGDENFQVFDADGTVKAEFQYAWKSLMQHDNNPLIFLMLPILEEFEGSGWTKSAHYDQLGYRDIADAIELENQGDLAEKLPNGDLDIEDASLLLQDYDYSDIEPLYKEFSASHNMELLAGVQPLEIIKLYYYANKVEDIETMWHLTADDELKPSLEKYKNSWRQRPDITERMDSISIRRDHISRLGRKLLLPVPITFSGNADHHFTMDEITLVTERDQVWLMKHQINEFYSKDDQFGAYDTNVRRHYGNLQQSQDMDVLNDATPGEIAGIFILALENEDTASMKLLLNKIETRFEDDDFLRNWKNNTGFSSYSKLEAVYFRADTYFMDGQTIYGSVNFFTDLENWESGHGLQLEKTGASWKVSDMFGY